MRLRKIILNIIYVKKGYYYNYIVYDHGNKQLASFKDIYCIVYDKKLWRII